MHMCAGCVAVATPATLANVCAHVHEVSLAEYSLFYRALLQKRPIILMRPHAHVRSCNSRNIIQRHWGGYD